MLVYYDTHNNSFVAVTGVCDAHDLGHDLASLDASLPLEVVSETGPDEAFDGAWDSILGTKNLNAHCLTCPSSQSVPGNN